MTEPHRKFRFPSTIAASAAGSPPWRVLVLLGKKGISIIPIEKIVHGIFVIVK